MKKSKTMIAVFILPALLAFGVVFAYPVSRTLIMSFFNVSGISQPANEWTFAGIDNYTKMFNAAPFQMGMTNMLKIWLVGGVLSLGFGLLFAVILTSGVRFKNFFRAAIYLPNTISFVALATMWTQYVFNPKYGAINKLCEAFGWTQGASFNWMSGDSKFWAMMIAFSFGSVGYYMLIYMSGIDSIPQDLYEAATLDGAGKFRQFTEITIPLLKNVMKTNLTLWSITAIGFFGWSRVFSPLLPETSTITPAIYLMDIAFGSRLNTNPDAGAAAAIGVTLSVFVVAVFLIFNFLFKDHDLEY